MPGKNLRPLAGKPLIAHTIKAAIASETLDRLIVSTDDEAIAAVSRELGAETPFLRPPELALDTTASLPVVLHAVSWLRDNQDYTAEWLMLLQPTSPLRTAEDIRGAIQLAREKDAEAVVSVTPAHQHPWLMREIASDGRLLPRTGAETVVRRQDLCPLNVMNGAIYLLRTEVLFHQKTFYPHRTYAYVMPVERGLDIDSAWDLHLAELILAAGPAAE